MIQKLEQGSSELPRERRRSVQFKQRWAEHRLERLPGMAAELLALGVDLIVVHGDSPAVRASMQATRTVPIFFLWVGDPLGQGLIQSLARPGGNVTGLSFFGPELEPGRANCRWSNRPGSSCSST